MDRIECVNEDEARGGSGANPARRVIGPGPEPVWRRSVRLSACLALGLALACSDGGEPKTGGGAAASPPDPAPTAAKPGSASPGDASAAAPAETRSQEELIAAGRSVYNANCIACHAIDPTVDGALGPAVAGSSLELLRARVVHGTYPEGYEPKRPSRVMVPLPHLEPKLPELAAYLQSKGG